jgi:uncharacterized protein (DUF2336 family)
VDRDLTALAYDRSPAACGELLESLMRSVIVGRRPAPTEAALFFDIARQLVDRVEPEVRVLFSQEVAAMHGTPPDVLMRLARDDCLVAGPVLRADNALDESQLIDLSKTLPLDHLADLAERRRLTLPVTDVLAARGDAVVLRHLACNDTCALSPASLLRMVAMADRDEALCLTLARRTDLPADGAARVVHLMADLLRGRRARPPVSERGAETATAPNRAPRLADIGELVRQVRAGRVTLDEVVARLADEDRGNDIAVALARLTDVDELSTLKVLVRRDPEGIALVGKALDLRPETWRSVVGFRRRRLKLSDADMRFELRDFAERSVEEARARLAQFQNRRSTTH